MTTGPSFIGLQMGSPPVEPADPQLAAGPSKLLEMVNVAGQVYDRNGNALGSSFALDGPGGFFQIPSAYEEQGDPLVHYDVLSGRFFAAMVGGDANGGTGILALAVSSGSDPQGTWKVYQFTVSGYFPDFPKVGISDDKVILTANLFDLRFNNTGCPTTIAQCLDFANAYWVIDKADLLNFAASADLTFFSGTCSHNFCYETIVPAVSLSSTSTHYMGTLNFSEPSTVLTVLSVTGSPGLGNVAVTVNNFAVPSIYSPQDARQPGVLAPRVATNFQDFFAAAFRDGMLWLGGNKGCSSSGFTDSACLDLIQVNTGTMTVAQNLTVSDSGAYLYYPDITIGAFGQLFCVFSRSSSTAFVGVYGFLMNAGESPGPFLPLKTGESTYTGTRWGDLSGASIDPLNPNKAWVTGEYAAQSPSWGTWIAELVSPNLPAAPTWASATPLSSTQIRVQWNDNSNNESGFNVYRYGLGVGQQVASLGPNSTSFVDSSLSPGTHYLYIVLAFNSSGWTLTPATITAITLASWPTPPVLESAVGTSTSEISFSWIDNAVGETGYKVFRFDSVAGWIELANLPPNSVSYTDSGLAPGTTYYYWVLAYNGIGQGFSPNIINASTFASGPAAGAPLANLGNTISASQVQVNWIDTSNEETGFHIQQFNGSTWQTVASPPADATTFTLVGLSAGELDMFRISSIGTNFERFSPAPVTIATQGSYPAPPTLASARGISQTQIEVNWFDNSTNETSFKLLRFNTVTGVWTEINLGQNVTSFLDSGLTPGQYYYYWLFALNSQGTGYAPTIIPANTYGP